MKSKVRNQSDADKIRERVLLGLAGNRNPGFHFPGYFLQLDWPRIGDDSIDEGMPAGPHCRDADGNINIAVLGMVLDTALATAPRLKITPGARQATVQLNAQFTGHPARGDLTMTSKLIGFTAGTAIRQSLASGTLFSAGKPVCHAHATFVMLPAPAGVTLAPLPWQSQERSKTEPLTDSQLDAGERAVMRACDAALAKADGRHSFIEISGACCRDDRLRRSLQREKRAASRQPRRPRAGRHPAGTRGSDGENRGASTSDAIQHFCVVHQPRQGQVAAHTFEGIARRAQLCGGGDRNQDYGRFTRAGDGQQSRGAKERRLSNSVMPPNH